MPFDPNKMSPDSNTAKQIEQQTGVYKPSVTATETNTEERLPQKQLPKAPDPSPFKNVR